MLFVKCVNINPQIRLTPIRESLLVLHDSFNLEVPGQKFLSGIANKFRRLEKRLFSNTRSKICARPPPCSSNCNYIKCKKLRCFFSVIVKNVSKSAGTRGLNVLIFLPEKGSPRNAYARGCCKTLSFAHAVFSLRSLCKQQQFVLFVFYANIQSALAQHANALICFLGQSKVHKYINSGLV